MTQHTSSNALNRADATVLREATQLRKQGRSDEALDLVRDAVADDRVRPHEMDAVGRFVLRGLAEAPERYRPLSVLLLGQCTTTWLRAAVAATGWGAGVPLLVQDGGYDNVLQELSALEDESRPDIVILVPWHQRLLRATDAGGEDPVREELEFWQAVWRETSEKGITRIVQVGYDWVVAGAAGQHLAGAPGGDIHRVRSMNDALRNALPNGAYFVPLEEISGRLGRDDFYDLRQYHWTKQPFSVAGLALLARHVAAGIRTIVAGPKKVLAVDLDNTIWGGVVGETGALGIALGESPEGEAFRSFQTYLRDLSRRGVLLAACSKNNPPDAQEPFVTHPGMILTLDHFAAFEANWEPKPANLRRIAEKLNLTLDSIVFFDDDPAERAHVRAVLPEVAVVPVGDDVADYIRCLESGLWFETLAITREDAERTRQYQVEHHRRRASGAGHASLEGYLASLQMRAAVAPICEVDMQRVVQLLAKTNQFNLTTRRHTDADVRCLLADPRAVGLTLRLQDRYGEYGLVGVLIAVLAVAEGPSKTADTLRIDTLLLSCRVIGRTVEQCFVSTLCDRATRLGYRRIVGEYIPSPKNGLVARLYEQLGFQLLAQADSKVSQFELSLDACVLPPSFVQVVN